MRKPKPSRSTRLNRKEVRNEEEDGHGSIEIHTGVFVRLLVTVTARERV